MEKAGENAPEPPFWTAAADFSWVAVMIPIRMFCSAAGRRGVPSG